MPPSEGNAWPTSFMVWLEVRSSATFLATSGVSHAGVNERNPSGGQLIDHELQVVDFDGQAAKSALVGHGVGRGRFGARIDS